MNEWKAKGIEYLIDETYSDRGMTDIMYRIQLIEWLLEHGQYNERWNELIAGYVKSNDGIAGGISGNCGSVGFDDLEEYTS